MTNAKKIVRESGYRQKWLARKAGVDQSQLSRYINGERPWPPSVLRAIANILRVSQKSLRD